MEIRENTNSFSFIGRLYTVFAEGTETLLKQFNTRSLIADSNQKLTTHIRAVIRLVMQFASLYKGKLNPNLACVSIRNYTQMHMSKV